MKTIHTRQLQQYTQDIQSILLLQQNTHLCGVQLKKLTVTRVFKNSPDGMKHKCS